MTSILSRVLMIGALGLAIAACGGSSSVTSTRQDAVTSSGDSLAGGSGEGIPADGSSSGDAIVGGSGEGVPAEGSSAGGSFEAPSAICAGSLEEGMPLDPSACGSDDGPSRGDSSSGGSYGGSSIGDSYGGGLYDPDEHAPYYALSQDLRRCAWPKCGGYFVSSVNHRFTVCADGVRRRKCYVADLGLGGIGPDPAQEAEIRGQTGLFLVRGDFQTTEGPTGPIDVFALTGAWRGQANVAPIGWYYRAEGGGVECVTQPCPIVEANLLGWDLPPTRAIALSLEDIAADPSDAYVQLAAPEGLLVVANRISLLGDEGERVLTLIATEYYMPFL